MHDYMHTGCEHNAPVRTSRAFATKHLPRKALLAQKGVSEQCGAWKRRVLHLLNQINLVHPPGRRLLQGPNILSVLVALVGKVRGVGFMSCRRTN